MAKEKISLTYNAEKNEYFAVDVNTGEVRATVKSRVPLAAIKLITESQQGFYDQHKDKFGKQVGMFQFYSSYLKQNADAEREISKLKLSGSTYRIYLWLKNNMAHKSCIVKRTKKSYLKMKDLEEIFGMSGPTVCASIKSLEKYDIIRRYDGKIYFNPYIAYKGNGIEEKTYQLFSDSRWKKEKEKES